LRAERSNPGATVTAASWIAASLDVLARHRKGDVLFVGHGAVGTLLLCLYAGFAIDRTHDQPPGGGHCFVFAKERRRMLQLWRKMEDLSQRQRRR
jgi:broad specificity phosphatase PhoE